jgi:dephospho-CoA kinase
VARTVTPPGSAALESVVRAFGRGVLRQDGTLDRGALGGIVFRDPAALARLEAIIHPIVRPRIIELLAAADGSGAESAGGAGGMSGHAPAVVIEAIKLVEGGLAALCDEVWLVTCDAATQRERLAMREVAAGRHLDRSDTEARIAAQSGLVARLTPSATRIIDTSGSLAESRSLVEAAFAAALGRQGVR